MIESEKEKEAMEVMRESGLVTAEETGVHADEILWENVPDMHTTPQVSNGTPSVFQKDPLQASVTHGELITVMQEYIFPDATSKPKYKSKILWAALSGIVGIGAVRYGFELPPELMNDILSGGSVGVLAVIAVLRLYFSNKSLK